MKEYRIKKFSELHDILDTSSRNIIYRGQADSSWDLLPKAGREPFNSVIDKTVLDYFKENALPYLDIPPENDFEWLAFAQHHGIPTRLLDWTSNPMIATFFAVVKDFPFDAAIYKYNYNTLANIEVNPFDFTEVLVYKPRGITQRIIAQQSFFTIHPEIKKPFNAAPDKGTLEKIIIDKDYRQKLKYELHRYGYNYFSVFQDLQGLSEYTEWRCLNRGI